MYESERKINRNEVFNSAEHFTRRNELRLAHRCRPGPGRSDTWDKSPSRWAGWQPSPQTRFDATADGQRGNKIVWKEIKFIAGSAGSSGQTWTSVKRFPVASSSCTSRRTRRDRPRLRWAAPSAKASSLCLKSNADFRVEKLFLVNWFGDARTSCKQLFRSLFAFHVAEAWRWIPFLPSAKTRTKFILFALTNVSALPLACSSHFVPSWLDWARF